MKVSQSNSNFGASSSSGRRSAPLLRDVSDEYLSGLKAILTMAGKEVADGDSFSNGQNSDLSNRQ